MVTAVLLLATMAAAPVRAEGILPAWRRQDARLSRRVTVHAPRIHVGTLARELTRQTGILIRAGRDGDGAGDHELMVAATDVPVGDLMDALWSTFSYRDGEWHWRRTLPDDEGIPAYEFTRPLRAQQFPYRFQLETQRLYERQAALLLGTVTGVPGAREQLEATESDVEPPAPDSRLFKGLQVIAETLDERELLSVLRGEKEVTVPVEALSERGQAFVQEVWEAGQAFRRLPDGRLERVPPPNWIQITSTWRGDDVSPNLFIHMETIGGYGYAGGRPLMQERRTALQERWQLPGDVDAATAEASIDPRRLAGVPTVATEDPITLETRLLEFERCSGVPVVARLPRRRSPDPGPAVGRTVAEFLDRIASVRPRPHRKWRHGMVLLTYDSWYREYLLEGLVPEALPRSVRERERSRELLGLEDLAELAHEFPAAALRLAATEYSLLRWAAAHREVLAVRHRSRRHAARLSERGGLPITELLQLAPPEPGSELAEALERDGAYAVRLYQRDRPDADTGMPRREFHFEVLDPRGRVLARRIVRVRRQSAQPARVEE